MQTAIDTVSCVNCNTEIPAEMAHYCFGMCYQCQCEAHACGEIDMDATDGFADHPRYEDCGDYDGMLDEDIAVREGRAEYITESPSCIHAREMERLVRGVFVPVTRCGATVFDGNDIPF